VIETAFETRARRQSTNSNRVDITTVAGSRQI
jgi:hypothetical protein